jgi:transposase-like protein
VDESCFSHKPKNHRGRRGNNPIYVFGVVDTSYKPSLGYMCVVSNRKASTLLPIIRSVILPGTTVHNDEWSSYTSLSNNGTVNHSLYFKDPITGIHIQNIESYWNKHKYRIKRTKGMRYEFLPEYLNEWMWRERF